MVRVGHVLVAFKRPQAHVGRNQVAARLPVVLQIEVRPVRAAVLIAAADAGGRRRQVTQEEVRKGVSGERAGMGIRPANAVSERCSRIELETEEVGANLKRCARGQS